jgi:hypothetical protein
MQAGTSKNFVDGEDVYWFLKQWSECLSEEGTIIVKGEVSKLSDH